MPMIDRFYYIELAQCVEHKSNKHEKYYHSIKVGTLGGHNPLCSKSYKIRTPMKNFEKPNFKMK